MPRRKLSRAERRNYLGPHGERSQSTSLVIGEALASRLKREAESLLGGNEVKLDHLCVEADQLDALTWQQQVESQNALYDHYMQDRAGFEQGSDLFCSVFKHDPALKKQSPNPAMTLALKALMDSPDYKRLHEACSGDDMLAAGSSMALHKRLLELIPAPLSNAMHNYAQALMQRQQATRLQDVADQISGPQKKRLEKAVKQLTQDAQINQGSGDALMKQITQVGSQMPGEIIAAAQNATNEVADEVDNLNDLSISWGTAPGQLAALLVDPELRKAIESKTISNILKLAGRMEAVIGGIRALRPLPAPDKVSLVQGCDIANVLSSELALLADRDTEVLFDKKYCERGLLQYQRETDKPGKGPFIVCLDESGSMNGAPNEWAKAVAMALEHQARNEHRRYGVVAFSSHDECRMIHNPTPTEFLAFISHFYSGGTDFGTPLRKALTMIHEDEKLGDIIFITDGESSPFWDDAFEKEFRAKIRETSCRVLGIQIGNTDRGLEQLEQFSDKVFRLNYLAGENGITGLIEEMK